MSFDSEMIYRHFSDAGCTRSPSLFGEIPEWELHETRLCEWDSLHSYRELSIYEEQEQGEGVQARARLRRMRWWRYIRFGSHSCLLVEMARVKMAAAFALRALSYYNFLHTYNKKKKKLKIHGENGDGGWLQCIVTEQGKRILFRSLKPPIRCTIGQKYRDREIVELR